MSEKVICDKEDLTAIANAVRTSTGSSNTYTVSELSVAAVSAIENGGSADAVLYIEQTLTEEQKEQARTNISAVSEDELQESVNEALEQAKASGEFDGNDGYIPVRGVDYYTDADQEDIVQQVIAALGTPVFGRVDKNNVITLSGKLLDGIYILKYEDTEGEVLEIGRLVVGERLINQIPISTDTDGSIYNGTGWKTGYRVSSSGEIKALGGYGLTGFIPFKKGDVLRGSEGIVGLIVNNGDAPRTGYNVISLYDTNKNFIKNVGLGRSYDPDPGVTFAEDDSFVFESTANENVTDAVSYVRVTTANITSASIITVNQEIE